MKQSFVYRFFFLFVIFCVNQPGFSQSKVELENQKKSNLEKLEFSRKLLESTRKEQKTSLYQLNLLSRQINIRNELIKNYETELDEINNQIEEIDRDIEVNSERLDLLKEQYAAIIRNSYKNLEETYYWMYLLSSEDINQAYERVRYIKYLNEYRKDLYSSIEDQNDSLLMLKHTLDLKIKEKENAIGKIKEESDALDKDKKSKNEIVRELKGKEKELLKEIKEREDTQNRIEREIRRIIEEEVRKARSVNKTNELTPEEKLVSGDFMKNKGGLPWPTLQGVITGSFGEQNHPVIPGIKIRSNGVDITTVKGMEVRSVFKGEVTVVSAILGANYTVIIKHGNYRSVYQNIVNVKVKAGDKVDTKQIIGSVGTNTSNESKLHFELWNGMTVIDPEAWLSK